MKTKLLFIFLGLLSISFISAQPTCYGNRYSSYVFGNCDSIPDIGFGQNTTMAGVTVPLLMDIYQPSGDNAPVRPLIIFIHGGSFIQGTRKDLRALCLPYTLRGFVTASIDYRLIPPVMLTDSFTLAEGLVQAMSDAKAAIQFFLNDVNSGNNTFRVDTSNIFIGGVSAGAIIASQVAYLNSADIIPAYFANSIMNNGGFPGNSTPGRNFRISLKGVLSFSGALWRPNWLSAGEPPLFLAHDNPDPIVPCGHGMPTVSPFPPLPPFPVYFDGGCSMQQRAQSVGVECGPFYTNTPGHVTYFTNPVIAEQVMEKSANFMYNIICNGLVTQVPGPAKIPDLSVFPNPAKDYLNVKINNQALKNETFQILNTLGILVQEFSLTSYTQINIANLTPGLYYGRLKNSTNNQVKFIKE